MSTHVLMPYNIDIHLDIMENVKSQTIYNVRTIPTLSDFERPVKNILK